MTLLGSTDSKKSKFTFKLLQFFLAYIIFYRIQCNLLHEILETKLRRQELFFSVVLLGCGLVTDNVIG